jgi:hypothetical protein
MEIRSTVVAYFIALRITEVTAHVLEREPLIHAALTAFMLLSIERSDPQPSALSGSSLRDAAIRRLGELHATADARAIVEQRFLGGKHGPLPGRSTRVGRSVCAY